MPEIQIAWTFTPQDYFEEPLVLEVPGYRFEIDAGRALVRLPDQVPNQALCDEVNGRLSAIFESTQLLEARAFALSEPAGISRVHENVNRDDFVLAMGI